MVGGGEVMEVMMTGGDGGEMNEDTLAQVVNMLQMEGQLSGGNHTIIIRQPDSNEIQMIQTTSNGGELIVSKASEADIQAMQAGNGLLENVSQELLDASGQQTQLVMMDEGGNLVERVVQMQDEGQSAEAGGMMQLAEEAIANAQGTAGLLDVPKGDVESNEILDGLVPMEGTHGLMENSLPTTTAGESNLLGSSKPITISTTTNRPRPKTTTGLNGEVVSIKISTGFAKRRETKSSRTTPKNVIKISTVTGQQKYQPPKFHKCEACAINFVSKVAYMNHMDNCPSRRRSLTPGGNDASKGGVTYTCVFCETKFTSRLVLMQHVRTCDRAKTSKNLAANSKLRVTTSESKLKLVSSVSLPKSKGSSADDGVFEKKAQKGHLPSSRGRGGRGRPPGRKKLIESILDPEDEPLIPQKELDSEDDDDNAVVYDDEDDLNDDEIMEDDTLIEETMAPKRSQKHLGPIIVRGMFKCRDCERTFSKEHQYNRHVRACTNAPFNASRVESTRLDNEEGKGDTPSGHAIPVSTGEAAVASAPAPPQGVKRKRGRPPLRDYLGGEGASPAKRRALGPKIVSVNPRKVSLGRGRPSGFNSDSDDDPLDGLSRIRKEVYGRKNSRLPSRRGRGRRLGGIYPSTNSSLSKVVKISPSDTLIKQTGRAILSKMNKEKYSKFFRETPFCGLCGDKFETNQELVLHTQICHSEDLLHLRDALDGKGNLSSLKCPLCDLHFVSAHVVLLHLVSFHDKDLRSVQEELETQNLNLICPFCGEMHLTQELLKEHMATRHLDRLINKPSTNVSPSPIDIHALIREKNNGSMLPTGTLLSKKEKVLCPECGLFFFKSYFEHHRCAAETFSHTARRFICSESQCSSLTFFKRIHLLTHLQQVHEKSLSCEMENFDSLTQFLEWLKKEEGSTKMKYTKALQRMKQGRLTTVWICHRFHNAMKDPTSVTESSESVPRSDRLNQCYSRIHAETSFNTSTSRYDGKTCIRYYPNHKHPTEDDLKVEQRVHKAPPPVIVQEKSPPPVLQTFSSEQSAFSDAAELKQLLEDDDEFEPPSTKTRLEVEDASDVTMETIAEVQTAVKESEDSMESTSNEGTKTDDSVSVSVAFPTTHDDTQEPVLTEPTEEELLPLQEGGSAENIVEEEQVEGESLPASEISEEKGPAKEPKSDVSGLVTFSDTDLLLEKMLGEHDGVESEPAVVTMPTETDESNPPTSSGEGPLVPSLAPTEAKITDVDMLEAFGGCLTPEESSNPSTASTTQQEVPVIEVEPAPGHAPEGEESQQEEERMETEETVSQETKEEEPQEESQEEPQQKELKEGSEPEDEDDEDENTYVLPADLEEWSKLFDLVASQVNANSLAAEEMEEAKELLTLENKILAEQLEKQIDVFQRLCSLANVQMT